MRLLNEQITRHPGSSSTRQLLADIDTGGTTGTCRSPDGIPARPGDGRIDICEAAENRFIDIILAPDIQVQDPACGNDYGPVKIQTLKDSFSIGLGFTAVPARF